MGITHFKSHIAAVAGISGAGAVRTQSWEAPAAASADAIHALIALTTSEQDIDTEITNPDIPRVLSITSAQATATGDVVITGTDINDTLITDTIALNGATTVDGVKAFKTVTNIHVPVKANSDEVSIGISVKLGLDKLLPNFSDNGIDAVLMAAADGVYEATRPTVVAHITDVSQNLISFDTSPNGVKDLVAMFLSAQTN